MISRTAGVGGGGAVDASYDENQVTRSNKFSPILQIYFLSLRSDSESIEILY